MFTMMNFARLEVGIEGVAIADRAYQHARDYAKTRIQGREIGVKTGERVSIIHHPDVRRMLMGMKAQTEAMRALATLASFHLDQALLHPDKTVRAKHQAYFDLLTPVVKGWCTEQAIEIASTGVQVHCGMGFVEETGAAQYLRDARITAIYEGTTGIQANDLVGRKIAYERGATVKVFLAEMRALDAELQKVPHPAIAAIRGPLAEGITALAEATDWLLATFPGDMKAASAGAVPFLKLFGTVAGGWLMARAALIAKSRLDAGSAEFDFYRGKIATARFFAEHILPLARAYRHEIVAGSASVLALEEAQF
jgi:acyl-CoA dehydrogenase